jgi:hypothetical protein
VRDFAAGAGRGVPLWTLRRHRSAISRRVMSTSS